MGKEKSRPIERRVNPLDRRSDHERRKHFNHLMRLRKQVIKEYIARQRLAHKQNEKSLEELILEEELEEIDRRHSTERRQRDRRDEDRAKKRREAFRKDEERKKVQQALKIREKKKKADLLFSYERKNAMASKINEKTQQDKQKAIYDKERLAKSLAMANDLDLNQPAASRLMLWQKEVESLRAQFKKGKWGRGAPIKKNQKDQKSKTKKNNRNQQS